MILQKRRFYSHVNYSVTKILGIIGTVLAVFYSHVNYSVTKINANRVMTDAEFYSHVNYSVTKMQMSFKDLEASFTVT